MTADISGQTAEIAVRARSRKRFIVAVAGPPGSGKSTFASQLSDSLQREGLSTTVVPMDGFHLDNTVLQKKGLLNRKGAPETFDFRGFLGIVEALHQSSDEVFIPIFDRSRELAIAAAGSVRPEHQVVLIEGNYLLLDLLPWSRLDGCFDWTIMLMPPLHVLEERLMHRWLELGMGLTVARAKVQENDLPNGQIVRSRSRVADVTLG